MDFKRTNHDPAASGFGGQPSLDLESGKPVVVAWGRPHTQPQNRLHALVAVNHDGNHHTVCGGSWDSRSPGEIFFGATVTQWPKCRACCDVTGDVAELHYERCIEIGLQELAANAPADISRSDIDRFVQRADRLFKNGDGR